jgi:uncharacterized membrane protein YgdD (TMEM256/DUF423 family)
MPPWQAGIRTLHCPASSPLLKEARLKVDLRAYSRRLLTGAADNRAAWMRAAALSALAAVGMLSYSARLGYSGEASGQLRWAAQLHLVHAMAAFTCATFMNIGAPAARHAALTFITGGWLLAGPVYMTLFGGSAANYRIQVVGFLLVCAGWIILAWSAKSIDTGSVR